MKTAVHPKVAAGTASGAAATVLIYLVSLTGHTVPGEVGAAIATLLALAGGYAKSST